MMDGWDEKRGKKRKKRGKAVLKDAPILAQEPPFGGSRPSQRSSRTGEMRTTAKLKKFLLKRKEKKCFLLKRG